MKQYNSSPRKVASESMQNTDAYIKEFVTKGGGWIKRSLARHFKEKKLDVSQAIVWVHQRSYFAISLLYSYQLTVSKLLYEKNGIFTA